MASQELKFGIRPPNWVSQDETFDEITEWIVRMEQLGFDSVHTGEQILAKIPPYESTVYDQQVTMSMWAANTESVEIGSLIKVMPLMNPVHVAKIYGSLDLASGGRTILGVGNGYKEHEFDTFDIPMRERGQRTEEGVEIAKRLWTEDHVDYHGEVFDIEDVTIEPKPVQDPHPPVWFGATLEEFTPGVVNLHERVGRIGDGWVPMPYSNTDREMLDPADLGRAWDIIEESATEHGRDPEDIEIVYSHWAYVLDDEKEELDRCKEVLGNWFAGSWEEANQTYPIGTAEEVVETVTHMASELPRVDRFIFTPFDFNEAVPERIATEVRPMLEDRFG